MVIKVHIWMPKVGKELSDLVVTTAISSFLTEEAASYGHASLSIPGRAYMSYWPPLERGKVSGTTLSYEEDMDECGGKANHTISLYNLDEKAALAYWQQVKDKPFNQWRHNCCTVATRVIHTGFNTKVSNDVSFFLKVSARALLHPFESFDVLSDDWLEFLVTNNEPYSLLKLVKYYKMLSD